MDDKDFYQDADYSIAVDGMVLNKKVYAANIEAMISKKSFLQCIIRMERSSFQSSEDHFQGFFMIIGIEIYWFLQAIMAIMLYFFRGGINLQ